MPNRGSFIIGVAFDLAKDLLYGVAQKLHILSFSTQFQTETTLAVCGICTYVIVGHACMGSVGFVGYMYL